MIALHPPMTSIRAITLASTLVLPFVSACDGESANANDDDTGEPTEGSTDDAACAPGYEGCVCVEGGVCLDGLACLSNLCVQAPGDDTTTDAPAETSGDDEESSEDDDDDETGDLSVGTESTETTSPVSDESSSGDEESSTTEPEPECLESDNYCVEGELQTCVEGQWQETTCVDHCLLTGYESQGCANADSCACSGFADDYCFYAAAAYCLCDGSGCDDAWLTELFDICIAGEPILDCYYPYLDQDTYAIDCTAAANACL